MSEYPLVWFCCAYSCFRHCSNPVQAAYISSLESQISSLRDELATVYKTQGQNAQRLLAMNETLREKEEAARLESEGLRLAHEELTTMREKIKLHSEFMHEKDRTAQVRSSWCGLFLSLWSWPKILHDEINTLQLELGQIEDRNQTLTRDNAKLLQRWLDAKQSEANRMNEANDFYQEMRSQRQAVVEWRDGAPDPAATAGAQALHDALEEDATLTHGPAVPSRSGNGQSPAATATPPATDGTRSPNPASVSLTPNG
jgi:autophagy-related protein 16